MILTTKTTIVFHIPEDEEELKLFIKTHQTDKDWNMSVNGNYISFTHVNTIGTHKEKQDECI